MLGAVERKENTNFTRTGNKKTSYDIFEMGLIARTNYHFPAEHHHRALEYLISLLAKDNRPVNYDHIKSTIPREKTIPLWYVRNGKVKKGDISFFLDRFTLVIIEVKTFHRDSIEKYTREGGEDGES